MINRMLGAVLLVMILAPLSEPLFAEDGLKQPIFLMCPHKKRFSAWSLYLSVDKADPSKVMGIGLEKLSGKNSEDLAPDGYEKVLRAQKDPSTAREPIASLDAANFGSGQLRVEKDDALQVSVSSVDATTLRLMISMRISADLRFTIGGKEQNLRDVLITYNKATQRWTACATKLQDSKGQDATGGRYRGITGIVFPVTGTGIYRVVGVMDDGDAVILFER